MLSPICTVVESTVVVVPWTYRLPAIVTESVFELPNVTLPFAVSEPEIVTLSGKPIVTVPPEPKVTEPPVISISLAVPWTVNEVLPSTAVPDVEP